MIIVTIAKDENSQHWKEWYAQVHNALADGAEVHIAYKIENIDNQLVVPDHTVVPDGVIIHYIRLDDRKDLGKKIGATHVIDDKGANPIPFEVVA